MNKRSKVLSPAWHSIKSILQALFSLVNPDKPGIKLLLAVLLAALCAALITPGLFARSLPIGDDDLGKPAKGDIKASRDFQFPDLESTRRNRKEAADKVPTVYDLDMGAARETIARIRQVFSLYRKEIIKIRARLEQEKTAMEAGNQAGNKALSKKEQKTRKNLQTGIEKQAMQKNNDSRQKIPSKVVDMLIESQPDAFSALGVNIAEADLKILARDGFSRKVESALVKVVRRVLSMPIVADKEFLRTEALRGITVRSIRSHGGRQSERLIKDFSALKDVAEVRESLGGKKERALRNLPGDIRKTLVHLARALVKPVLTLNRVETEKRRQEAAEAVKPTVVFIKKGEMVVRDGERITQLKLTMLRKMEEERSRADLVQMFAGAFLFVLLLLLAAYKTGLMTPEGKARIAGRDLVMMTMVLIFFILLLKAYGSLIGPLKDRFSNLDPDIFFYLVPVAAAAMVVRMFTPGAITLVFSLVTSMIFGLMAEGSIHMAVYALVGCGAGMVGSSRAAKRKTLIVTGLKVGLVQSVAVLGLSMFESNLVASNTAVAMLLAFSSGLTAGVIVTGTAPILESLFGYTTDVQLLELANLNHPLLKELIVQAPGTYHHSIIVASLVEAAAEAIGANPLLARVAAYYHDIGKIKMPMYFSENIRDQGNRHDKLAPSMSALIIMNHVKEGVDLARAYGLPAPVVDIIGEHHGQSLIKYFYQKALDQAEDSADEKQFRYHGPKPQTPEAALVMLADAVEATARSISDPTPARLTGLVQKTINRFFADGQLDECELTLKDLHEIARAFNRVLSGMYHHRVDYPEPATKDKRDEKKDQGDDKKRTVRYGDEAGEKKEDANADKGQKARTTKEVDVLEEDGGEDLKRLGMS